MELGGGGWSWVEVDGAGWRWVHGLVIHFSKGPSLLKKIKQTFLKGESPTLKRDSNTGVSCEYCEIFKSTSFAEHLRKVNSLRIISIKIKHSLSKET